MESENYIGSELELFSNATNWKRYYSKLLRKYIFGNVLEVGAGIGETTKYLFNSRCNRWHCLEPDLEFCEIIKKKIGDNILPSSCVVNNGKMRDLKKEDGKYNSILYIDVLEHIEEDLLELTNAEKYLADDGRIVILCPAHNFLYSAFDKKIGHFRRYNTMLVKKSVPKELMIEKCFYLDSIGMLLSYANKMLLNQDMPTSKQINFWDKTIVPLSKVLDPLLCYRFGKSIVTILQRA